MNLELVDKEIARLEDLKHLKRILADPKMAELAEQVLLSNNGTGNQNGHQGKKAKGSANPRESEADAVRRAITIMVGELTVGSVSEKVRESGRNIANGAVSRVMKQMAKRGELDIAQRRFGSRGSIYERGKSFREVK